MNTRLLILILALLSIAPALRAQNRGFKLNVEVNLVEVHVSVVDDKDHPVGNMNKENFRLLEDRVEQDISVFKHEDIPVSLGLVIDNSRSIERLKPRLDAAALSFVRKGNPEDETLVVHFDDTAWLARDFTHTISQLEDTLTSVKPFGQTAIYDALILALDHMRCARLEKKAILLITDGEDNVGQHTLEEAIAVTKRVHVAVYAVGLISESGGKKAEASLTRIAEASGGRAYFPKTVDEARTAMERVARDLREQYTLGFFSTNPRADASWRSLHIELIPPPGVSSKLKANYRQGYYGPSK